MRFLLVEDNRALAESIRDRLGLDGHAVDIADDLAAAADCLAGAGYDLILLDIMLPDGDGRDFLSRHRAARHNTPMIVITARSEVSDRVRVLDLGADDYLTKPFDFTELEARWNSKLAELEKVESSLADVDSEPHVATAEERSAILVLGEQFAQVWHNERYAQSKKLIPSSGL